MSESFLVRGLQVGMSSKQQTSPCSRPATGESPERQVFGGQSAVARRGTDSTLPPWVCDLTLCSYHTVEAAFALIPEIIQSL
jgi:hypothetical protein